VQPYAVPFKEEFAAALPIGDGTEDQPMAEFMVVYVKTGSFAIDLETDMKGDSQQVVVSTPDENIQTLEPWSADPPHYVWNHRYLTINGEICTRACPIDPDMPVLLMPGDFAVAEKGALCIYCLLNNNEGLLEVFVLLDAGLDSQDFSWIRDWDNSQATASASLPVNSEPMVMAWAFNPGTKCDH